MCRRRKSLYEHPAENQSRMSKSHHAGEECRNRYGVGCVVSPVPDQWPRPSTVAVRRQQDRRSPCRRAGGLPQQSPGDDGSRPIADGRASPMLRGGILRTGHRTRGAAFRAAESHRCGRERPLVGVAELGPTRNSIAPREDGKPSDVGTVSISWLARGRGSPRLERPDFYMNSSWRRRVNLSFWGV